MQRLTCRFTLPCFRLILAVCRYGVYGERQLGWDAFDRDANDTTGTLKLTERLRAATFNHRATFIQESDFALLASKGINTVRIPIGFWLFQETQVRPHMLAAKSIGRECSTRD